VTAVGNGVDGGRGTEVTAMGWTEDGGCGGGGRLREECIEMKGLLYEWNAERGMQREMKARIITSVQ
jgi:hypothetical protein